MIRRQQGFTLVEIVIAFTILAMGSVLLVNVITQSSTRVVRVNDHLSALNALESAIAVLRTEIANRPLQPSYRGEEPGGYRWYAEVLGPANVTPEGRRRKIKLYNLKIEIYQRDERPRLALTTILADR